MKIRVIDPNLNPEDICKYIETWNCDKCNNGNYRVMSVYDIDYLPRIIVNTITQAKWIQTSNDKYKCSNCGSHNLCYGDICVLSSYCPHCGAEMIGVEEDVPD